MAALEIKKQTEGYFRFILDGDTDNAIIDNAPNATSFGDAFNFKTRNGANIIKKQFIKYDEITYIDISDVSFTFASVDEVWIKLIDEEFFLGLNQSGGGGGSSRFDGLNDTFSYIGNDGKVPVVDQTNLKLIPVAFYNFSEFTQLLDVSVPSLIAGKNVSVENVLGVPKIVLTDPPPAPELLANAVGFFNIADLTTQTTPINYTTGTIVLTNDGAGSGSTSLYSPFGVTSVWNSLTNRFDFNDLTLGDEVLLRIDLKITTSTANQVVNISMVIGEGTADELTFRVADKYYKNTVIDEPLTASVPFFIGTELRRTAPAKLTFSSVGNDDATIKIGSFFPTIIRKNVNIVTIEATGDPEAAHYKGVFNATTGIVTGGGTLSNGLGHVGDFYKVSVSGIYNFGAGAIQFYVNDFVIYNNIGNIWEKFINNNWLNENVLGSGINDLTAKTTPVDADYAILMDSADSNKAKKWSFANLKALLLSYFEGFFFKYVIHSTVTSSALTGTTTPTVIIANVPISAGLVLPGDILEVRIRVIKTGTGGTCSFVAGVSPNINETAANLAGPNQKICNGIISTAINTYAQSKAELIVKSATDTRTYGHGTGIATDDIVNIVSTITAANITWSGLLYFNIAITNNSAADSTVVSYYEILRKRG